LHYALVTGKKAGVVLILEDVADERFWVRMNVVIEEYNLPIETFLVKGGFIASNVKSAKVRKAGLYRPLKKSTE